MHPCRLFQLWNSAPYEWVDEAITIIQESGIVYDVGPFATVLEGTYEQVTKAINDVNNTCCKKGVLNGSARFSYRLKDGDITGDSQTGKFKSLF